MAALQLFHRFELHEPDDLSRALFLLRTLPGVIQPLGGGTDLLVRMKRGLDSPAHLVSLRAVEELTHRERRDSFLSFGAGVKLADLVNQDFYRREFPLLGDTARIMGSPQIRNLATVGGNICNAAPSADLCPPLIALGAEIILRSLDATRTLHLEGFFTGPGQTVRSRDELLTRIRIPLPRCRFGASYMRVCTRATLDIAVSGVASYLEIDEDGIVTVARIVLGAVAPTPVRAGAAEKVLVGNRISSKVVRAAADASVSDAAPISDVRGSEEYRKEMVRILTARTLHQAQDRCLSSPPDRGAV